MRRTVFLVASVIGVAVTSSAEAACNTRAGFVANQPSVPLVDTNSGSAAAESDQPVDIAPSSYDDQTLKLNLSRDITSLIGFAGRYTAGAPVLGVRMENLPDFDSKRHCNAIQPILYKPRIEHLLNGRVRASVDKDRFQIEFDPKNVRQPWLRDSDSSKRFYWIFPQRFPALNLPSIAQSYDVSLRQQPVGSDRRRWVAEAYLDLSMRYNSLIILNRPYPQGWQPRREDLAEAMLTSGGLACADASPELVCLAAHLIERNETASPGPFLAKTAFVVGDALLQDSGISTGVRQLDFGTTNDQANKIVDKLFPSTLARYRRGFGYRRAIRTWDIDLMTRWFDEDGAKADAELSLESAKRLLLTSHAQYLAKGARDWAITVQKAYPLWDNETRTGLALIAIDLENVSGHRLRLPPTAQGVCDVLADTTPAPKTKRSNHSVARDQLMRISNGRDVLAHAEGLTRPDWPCLDNDLAT